MANQVPKDVATRLEREQVIWLTTTKADGTPLPNPVWFLWNGTEFLVFAMANSVKMRNMTRNPRVSLNLNSDSDGDDVAIFQVEAQTQGVSLTDAERTAYLSKYEEGLKHIGMTPEALMKAFRPVRLTLTKFRTVEAVG
jgi:PPOX class probable F420-dependent enzyme